MKNAVTAALLLGVLCLVAAPGPTVAGETIGVVRTASGDATITRVENPIPAAPGMKLLVGDTLGTGPDGSSSASSSGTTLPSPSARRAARPP